MTITAVLDLHTDDVAAAAAGYGTLLNRAPGSSMSCGNVLVRLRDDIEQSRVLFVCDNGDRLPSLLARRGLRLVEVGEREWQARGLPVGIAAGVAPADRLGADGEITGVDHLVLTAADRDAAVALFGSVLGLDFRLDRPVSDGFRQLFFRGDDLVVEVLAGREPDAAAPDEPMPADPLSVALWGIAWSTTDLDAAWRRLGSAGMDVSPVRPGRKPGTRVMSVRERALATRTLLIDPGGRAPSSSSRGGLDRCQRP